MPPSRCKTSRRRNYAISCVSCRSAFLLLGIGIIFSGVLLLCERGYIAYLRPRLLRATANSPSRLNWCSLFSVSVSSSLKQRDVKQANALISEEREEGEGSEKRQEGRCVGAEGHAQCQEKVDSAARELVAARARIAALEHQLSSAAALADASATIPSSYSAAPLTGYGGAMGNVSPPGYARTAATQPRCRRHHRTAVAAASENGQRHVVVPGARQNSRQFETVL